jgi:hypothetical protein
LLFAAAVRDHPENEAYAASLKRAQEGKALAERDRTTGRLSSLADEISRPGAAPLLAFKGASGRKSSIDRIEVPVPKIVAKDYFQIKPTREWPQIPSQVIALSNVALKALQEGRDYALDVAKEEVNEFYFGWVDDLKEKIPGYQTYESLKDDFAELNEDVSKIALTLYEKDIDAVRTGVAAVANPKDTGRLADEHGERVQEMGKEARREALKVAGDSFWGHVKPGEEEDEKEETPGVVPIEKKKTDSHPDSFRIDRWLRR